MKSLLSIPLLTLPFLGCASPPSAERALSLSDRPQSAYAALVRALEVVDAIRDPRAGIQVRAVECDSLMDRRFGGEFVRVLLDVTVLAPDYDDALRTFAELERGLAAEATAANRSESTPWHRARRVFEDMDWNGGHDDLEAQFGDLVSVSQTVRVEVRRPGTTPVSSATDVRAGSQPILDYVRERAQDQEIGIGELDVETRVVRPRRGVEDMRYRIQPVDPDRRFSRDKVGHFLHVLEASSPGVRLTHVELAPPTPSDAGRDAWTFTADVNLRFLDA